MDPVLDLAVGKSLRAPWIDVEDIEKHAQIHQVTDFVCSREESLLTQLHEMETAFDGFWEKHQLKMEQYLQLWKFEKNFQEVRRKRRDFWSFWDVSEKYGIVSSDFR